MVNLFINAVEKHIPLQWVKRAFVNITTNQSNPKQSREQHLQIHIYTEGCFYLPQIKLTLFCSYFCTRLLIDCCRHLTGWRGQFCPGLFSHPFPNFKNDCLLFYLCLKHCSSISTLTQYLVNQSLVAHSSSYVPFTQHLFDSMCPHCCWNVFNMHKNESIG